MKHSLLLSALSAALLFPISTLAEAPSSNQLPAVVVTATGEDEEYQKLPVTISTVTPEQAEWAKPTWIGELVNQEPGVLDSRLRGPTDVFSIRQPIRFDNVYLYLQDNVPLQSPVTFNHGAFAFSSALTSPGGIEILKGPGTALYGTDAFAGIINVKSLAPDFKKKETETAVRGGNYGAFDTRVEHNQPINDKNAMRVAYSHQQEDGWRDMTSWDREQFLMRHSFKNNDDLTVNTIATYTYFDSNMSGTLDANTYHTNPRDDGLAPEVNRDEAQNQEQFYMLSSEVVKNLSDQSNISITPYIRRIENHYMAIWEPAVTPITDTTTDTVGLLNKYYYDYTNGAQTVVGFDMEFTHSSVTENQTRDSTLVYGNLYTQGLHYDYDVDYTSLAPFIQHTQPLTDKLTATAGLRYENAQYDLQNHLQDVAGDAFLQVPDRKDDFRQLNPSLGLSYALTPKDTVYFRYAHGFRIPQAADLYNLSSSQTSFTLEPETVDSYEIGYKGIPWKNLQFGSSVYYMRTADGITTGVSTPAGDVSENGGETAFYGIEGYAGMPLGEEFTINLSLALQRSEVLHKFQSASSEFDGNEVPGTPRTLGNLRLGYMPAWWKKVKGEVEVQHIGQWYMNEANTLESDNLFLLNLRSEYALTEKTSLDFKVLNLLDKRYASTAEAPSWAPDGIYRPGMPLTVSAGVTMKF